MATLGQAVANGQWGPAQKKKSFKSVVENADAGAGGNLQSTMTGSDTLAPATPKEADDNTVPDEVLDTPAAEPEPGTASAAEPVNPNPDAAQDEAIDATHKRLLEIMNSVPDVDYEGKYKELLAQAQAQPTTKAPGRAQSFFAALGSPANAPGMLEHAHDEEQKSRDEKFNRIMSLKEAILHADIQQQMAKGDFKKALAQSSELEKLHATQERLGREASLGTFKKQQEVLQGNRVEIENLRQDAALQRARVMIQGRKDLQQLSTKQQDMYAHEYATTYRTLMSQKNITGDPIYTDEQAQDLARQQADAAFSLTARGPESPGRVPGTGETKSDTSVPAPKGTTRGDLIKQMRTKH